MPQNHPETAYVEASEIGGLVGGVRRLQEAGRPVTLLAVCPNSDAVLEAAVRVAARTAAPMLFATTLNQVDRDGGYTGWTPERYVARLKELAEQHGCEAPLYPCLDHGGPWLKDSHAKANLTLPEAMEEVKLSITSCLEAGYALLHIDPTVDLSSPEGRPPEIPVVVERTVELLSHAESERERLGTAPVAYEVGTEEVAGGLADVASFEQFTDLLRRRLEETGLMHAWPCFVVGKVGTDLHTTAFDPDTAARLREILSPHGSLVKGHYTDWVDRPDAYPESGVGGANVGPEFTVVEADALRRLCEYEAVSIRNDDAEASRFYESLMEAVIGSMRWKKWLQPDEPDDFGELCAERRDWLVASGARYVWNEKSVLQARSRLYDNLRPVLGDPHEWVVERISERIEDYVRAFGLFGFDSTSNSGLNHRLAGV